MTDKTILAFGELLWDVLPTGAVLGGAPANFCYRLQSLGIHAQLVSRLGSDKLGTQARQQLEKLGVDLSLVQTDPKIPTGTVDVTLDAKGSASYVINEGVAYDYIEFTPELADAAKNAAVVCFGTLVQRAPATRETLYSVLETAKDALCVLDINLRKKCYDKVSVLRSIEHADVLKLNDDEVIELSKYIGAPHDDAAHFAYHAIEKFNLESCLVTRASRGVYAQHKSGEVVDLPGYQVEVADTIGSGDSFTAGFVSKRIANRPFEECCSFGNRLGALVATKTGGMAVFTKEEIENFSG